MTQPPFMLDGLRIDPATGVVTGAGGSEQLDPKVMAVLSVLADFAGQVVSREALHAHVWPNAVVTDDALTRCLHELRRQLVRAGGSERYRELIETLPKRGYRLRAAVETTSASTEPSTTATRERRGRAIRIAAIASTTILALAAAAYVLQRPPAERSIAVLPFLDMSERRDHGYLADGVAEEILNRLTQSPNLRVIARTSTFALRDKALDVPQIASRLNVRYVLEGSVRRSADRVRITAQLIDASTNAHEWSETYDRQLSDLFAIQDEIAHAVATALEVTLTDGGHRTAPPASFDAYQQFLQGQFLYNRRAPGDVERSVEYYRRAVESDPSFARAWAALAGAYSLLGFRQEQGEAARRAVELAPRLAVAHARLSSYYYHVGQPDKGDEHHHIAVALDPDDLLVLGFSAARARNTGDDERAVELWREVAARDPLSHVSRNNLGTVLLSAGRYAEGLGELRVALELSPDSANTRINIIRALVLLGRADEALQVVDTLPAGVERDYGQALFPDAPERADAAEAALQRLRERPHDARNSVYLADAYAIRGMIDECFAHLQAVRAAMEARRAEQPYLVWYFLEDVRGSPFLRKLEHDPRWAEILARPPRP